MLLPAGGCTAGLVRFLRGTSVRVFSGPLPLIAGGCLGSVEPDLTFGLCPSYDRLSFPWTSAKYISEHKTGEEN